MKQTHSIPKSKVVLIKMTTVVTSMYQTSVISIPPHTTQKLQSLSKTFIELLKVVSDRKHDALIGQNAPDSTDAESMFCQRFFLVLLSCKRQVFSQQLLLCYCDFNSENTSNIKSLRLLLEITKRRIKSRINSI